ncbi:MAG TPA: sulfatase-like hydrolase/transferase [Anaerolineales bacterium]|nr:sulfatase-like hydrolase/transferase [Anaerolineales bacterium]
MKRTIAFHPWLVAIYPILALLAFNVEWSPPIDAARALLVSLALATVVWLLARVLVRDPLRAALLTSLILILFFSYGHLYGVLKGAGWGATIGRHRYLAPAFAIVFLLAAWAVLRRLKDPRPLTAGLNTMAAVLVAMPIVSLAVYAFQPRPAPQATPSAEDLHLPSGRPAPDVYLIVLDAYTRQDTLRQVYDVDNRPFLDFLRSRGFFVADDSRSNYAQTALTFASVLNLNYIDALVPGLTRTSTDRKPLWDLIQHSEVRRRLEALGYETVAFASGLPGTEIRDSDVYLSPGTADERLSLEGSNPFESMLAQTTMLKLVSDGVVALPRFLPKLDYPYEIHRTRIRFILDNLDHLPASDRPRFVLAHIISPHPPFVFDAQGHPLTPDAPFTLKFTFAATKGSREEYLRGYADQVAFVNSEMERIVDSILTQSSTTPVILIMGDHGPDSGSGRVSYVQERMTNLDAYLLPTGEAGLYPGITPVNSFRVIFNEVFGGSYDLLPDRVLYSEYDHLYEFDDVTADISQP